MNNIDIIFDELKRNEIDVDKQTLSFLKKLIYNSRGKYKRNECLINVCKSDKDLS
jgi:hypothetical protein